MIFARSRRTTFVLGIIGGAGGLLLAVTSVVVDLSGGAFAASVALTSFATGGLGLVLWALIRLRSRPANRLGFFRDRLVVVQGRSEQHLIWERIERVTLADPRGWSAPDWPALRITDRLTVTLSSAHQLTFEPASFGLAPVGCRDLVIELRDDPGSRRRLPEFDSALDLVTRPVVVGELITPRI